MTSERYAEDLSRGGLDVGDFNNDGLDDFITGGCQGVVRLFINKGDQIHSNQLLLLWYHIPRRNGIKQEVKLPKNKFYVH